MLLQCVLTGRAQEAFSALSMADSEDYFRVKTAVLKAYELVPKAYRQQFRKLRKSERQTYVELVRELTMKCNRWVTASEVVNVKDLRELFLLEQFKDILPERVATYLNEHKVKNVTDAGVLADEYALTHKIHSGERFDWGSRDNCSGDPRGKVDLSTGATSNRSHLGGLLGKKDGNPWSRGMGMQLLSAPKHRLVLSCDLGQGEVAMGVRPSLPVPGVAVILGNDLAGGRLWPDVLPSPVVSSKPVVRELADPEKKLTKVFPACNTFFSPCAVTRAQAYKEQDPKGNLWNAVFSLPVPLSVSRSELVKLLSQVRHAEEVTKPKPAVNEMVPVSTAFPFGHPTSQRFRKCDG